MDRYLDLETWPRKDAYRLFSKGYLPFFAVTTPLDVTALYGFTKKEGVPVLANVAAILAPIWPDFPTPVIINLPLQLKIRLTALVKSSDNNGMRSKIAVDSSSKHLIAMSFTLFIK